VLATDLTVADFYLAGHEKRVDMLKFHPTVKDLLLTASSDMTMRLWDFRKMQEVQILEGFEEQVLGVAWSWAGDLVLQSCKDGKIHLYDARAKNTPVRVRPLSRSFLFFSYRLNIDNKRPPEPITRRQRASACALSTSRLTLSLPALTSIAHSN